MNILWLLLGLLGGLILCPIILVIIGKCVSNKIAKRHEDGKHYCNECEYAFISDDIVIEFKYCPYCGKELEHCIDKEQIDT